MLAFALPTRVGNETAVHRRRLSLSEHEWAPNCLRQSAAPDYTGFQKSRKVTRSSNKRGSHKRPGPIPTHQFIPPTSLLTPSPSHRRTHSPRRRQQRWTSYPRWQSSKLPAPISPAQSLLPSALCAPKRPRVTRPSQSSPSRLQDAPSWALLSRCARVR